MNRTRRWLVTFLVLSVLVAAAIAAGLHFSTRVLKTKIEAALGPRSEVAAITVGLASIEIAGIRVRGDAGWPAGDELRARRVVIVPDWAALLSRNIRIASIRIEEGYLSMLRRKDGRLVLLPSLLDGEKRNGNDAGKDAGKSGAAAPPEIRIDRIELDDATADFFDASVRQPPHRLQLARCNVRLGELRLPGLGGRTDIRIDGVARGIQHDGTVAIQGWAELASLDSQLHTRLAGVDLVAFQPYLIKAAETGVRRGTLDLELNSTVKHKHLHAPGKVALSGLELSGRSFMGMPRAALMRAMKDSNGRIAVEFAVDGNIDDPKFSLNEKFMAQVGIATAEALGISLADLVIGIGGAGGSAAQGVGGAVRKLLGN